MNKNKFKDLIVFDPKNGCEEDFMDCEGDCYDCPNKLYWELWELALPPAGERPSFEIKVKVKN